MKPAVPDIIISAVEELKDKLRDTIKEKLIKIILYGSYSRNTYESNSDVDILILTDMSEQEIAALNPALDIIAADLSLKYNIVLTPILKNTDSFSAYSEALPFYKNIVSEGIVLYG